MSDDIEDLQEQIDKLVNQVHDLEVNAGFKRNMIRCKVCKQECESRYTHDFVKCGCPNEAFCDGGTEYQRVGAKDLKYIQIYNPRLGSWDDYE